MLTYFGARRTRQKGALSSATPQDTDPVHLSTVSGASHWQLVVAIAHGDLGAGPGIVKGLVGAKQAESRR